MLRNLTAILVLGLAVIAFAGDDPGVSITIYNNNLGLVKDVRGLDIQKGAGILDFDDVASQIDPTSVNFRCLDDDNVAVLEQNYLYDLVSTEALLKRYLGKQIEIIGEDDTRFKGELLSFDNRAAIIKEDGGQIVMISMDKLINGRFPSLPEGLIIKPTLRWELESNSSGNKNCEVSYLTSGIQWNADYVAVVNDKDTKLDLSGWVTINNSSGASYENAKLKLVAGDIHQVTTPQFDRMEMSLNRSGAKAAPQFEEESFFEYHLYTLNRPATVNDKEIKQLTLFPTAQAKVKKVYIFNSRPSYYSRGSDKSKVRANLEFDNTKSAGLGMPLPKGKLRVYKEDSQGALQFVGEDQIDHTPKGEKVRVYLGDAFDITGERKLINVEDLGGDRRRETVEVTLKNHKDEDVVVTVVERASGWREWKIENSSHEYRKVDNSQIEFDLNVKSNDEETLNYTIQYF